MLQKRFILTVSLIAMFAVGMAHADIASVKYVNDGLSAKQATIDDLDDIRSGAAAGKTAVQPSSLAKVATSGSYNDLSDKPTIPTVNNATLTIQRNGTDVGTFTANASGNKTINITDNDTTYSAGTNITITDGVISAKDTVYTLPTASSSTKGGVKIGSNVNVSSDGTISVAAPYDDTSIKASIKAVDDKVGDSSVADQIDAVRATTIAGLTTEQQKTMFPTVDLTGYMIQTSMNNEFADYVDAKLDGLASVAHTGSYNDLSNKPTIPTVNNATLTIQKNGTTIDTFTANSSSNKTVNITVPTGALASKNAVGSSEITDGSIVNADIAADAAIAASKISGLAAVATSGSYNDLSNKPTIPSGALASKNAVGSSEITDGSIVNADIASDAAIAASKISGLAAVATSGSYDDLSNKPTIPTVNNATLTIQKNGTTIDTFTANSSSNKTVNITVPTGALASKSAVGSSEITDGSIVNADIASDAAIAASKISGLATVATTGSYNDLSDKPTIPTVNNATLTIQRNGTDVGTFTANASGNKTIDITDKDTTYTAGTNITITNGVISATDTVYTLPTASSSTKGGVKIGSNVNVSSDGTVSVATGTPSQAGVVKVGTIPSGSATSTTYATIWVE